MKTLVKGKVVKVWMRPATGEILEGDAELLEQVDGTKSIWKVRFITGGKEAVREINRLNA